MKWIRLYANYKDKATEYYNKADYTKMDAHSLVELMKVVYEVFGKADMGHNTYNKIDLEKLNDTDKVNLERYFWGADHSLVVPICATIGNKELGKAELLRFYVALGDAKDGLPVCEEVEKFIDYAKEAICSKSLLYEYAHEWAKAISQWQQCDNQPYNLWRIAECYMQLNQPAQAIAQLREIENFFKDSSSEAALRIAWVYKRIEKRNQYIAALHAVLNKYPKSPQSTQAHIELEQMGVRIGGGVNAGE